MGTLLAAAKKEIAEGVRGQRGNLITPLSQNPWFAAKPLVCRRTLGLPEVPDERGNPFPWRDPFAIAGHGVAS